MDDEGNYSFCPGCATFLSEPYIRCAVCPIQVCLACFGVGFECDNHENNHSYRVVRNDFCLFESHWTAAEEVLLLESIDDCGLGNWGDVARQLRTKTRQECERHYIKFYIEEPAAPLPVLSDPDPTNLIHPTPIAYKTCEDPPRPAVDSQLLCDMAGYSAARGDFATEYDQYAELDLRDLAFHDEDDDIENELKLAIVEIYNTRLMERARRKKIIRDLGLINLRKAALAWHVYDSTVGPRFLETIRRLLRMMTVEDADTLLEGLHYEHELKQKIKALQECRAEGLAKMQSARLYQRLKKRRNEQRAGRTALSEAIAHLKHDFGPQTWMQRHPEGSASANTARRSAPPLNITGLPGYDKLCDKEREICALARLVPDAYLEFKNILVNECTRNGSLRLAQARQLIKIDVNKTRKLYDFLLSEGQIRKEPI